MKVKRNSWHYKLWSSYFNRNPKNLCQYFWAIVFSIFVSTSWIFIFVILIWMSFIAIATSVGWWVLICVAFSASIFWGGRNVYYKYFHNRPPKEPGLFRSWLKAKKEKVCPIIEVED